jgi:hypothetical protein
LWGDTDALLYGLVNDYTWLLNRWFWTLRLSDSSTRCIDGVIPSSDGKCGGDLPDAVSPKTVPSPDRETIGDRTLIINRPFPQHSGYSRTLQSEILREIKRPCANCSRSSV